MSEQQQEWVIRIVCLASAPSIKLVEAGDFLMKFDPEAYNGRGHVETSPRLDDAIKFKDAASALAFYQTQSKVLPFRPDQRPNRPLTAYTIEVLQLVNGRVPPPIF